MKDKVVPENIKEDTESDLRMQSINEELSRDDNDLASDNATQAVGAIGLGMAASRIDVNSSLNKSHERRHKLADLDSNDNASDNVNDSSIMSARHNINALNAGRPNCKSV